VNSGKRSRPDAGRNQLVTRVAEILRINSAEILGTYVKDIDARVAVVKELWDSAHKNSRTVNARELKRIVRESDALIRSLTAASRYSLFLITMDLVADTHKRDSTSADAREFFHPLMESLVLLSHHAKKAAPPAKRGHPEEAAKEMAAFHAAEIFLRYRSARPTTTGTDFIEVCSLFWELVSGEKDQSLRRHIGRVLSKGYPVPLGACPRK
jgi:hypothetical protein